MCVTCRGHSIFCILPPHILLNIANKGDESQRKLALDTLALSSSLRATRITQAVNLTGWASRRSAAVSPAVVAAPKRTIYDGKHGPSLPGPVVRRKEGQKPVKDEAVNEAYDGLGATFDLYYSAYQRNSIDDAGLPLSATVHHQRDFDNAFWDGQQMVFGDGDGQLFNRFTIAIDVIGHELTHGVTEVETGLVYLNETGALNEHISDVFGSLVKQRSLKDQTADKADWLIGKGLLAKGVKGEALRSMKAPGTAYADPVLGDDPQPAHMDNYVNTNQDNGGVHINSGIPNKAFFLAATAIGGRAWDKAGRVWYHALQDPRILPQTTFQPFAATTVDVAERLYGAGKPEPKAIKDAWKQVGITV